MAAEAATRKPKKSKRMRDKIGERKGDTRYPKFRQSFVESQYFEIQEGVSFKTVRRVRPARGDIRDIIIHTVKQWIAEEVEAVRVLDHPDKACVSNTRLFRYGTRVFDSKAKKYRNRGNEMPVEFRHVMGASYNTRNNELEALDWETGEPVVPWVRVAFADASRLDLVAISPDDADLSAVDDGYSEVPDGAERELTTEVVVPSKKGSIGFSPKKKPKERKAS